MRLPADESAHCYGAEWWYYSGRLIDENENKYGVHAVIFHAPRIAMFGLSDAWMAHYAVLDERNTAFVYGQVRVFDAAAIDQHESGFSILTSLVQMSGDTGQDHLQAQMTDGRYALDLSLVDERGPVLHGTGGYIPFGEGDFSFYYSRPRMRATGSLEVDGQPHRVSGEFWFDRQWGRDLTNPWLGWDWFSVRLENGADMMLYVFRGTQSHVAFGTYVGKSGEPRPLSAIDFSISPRRFWTSPRTGVVYPVSWELLVIPEAISLMITAAVDDQELDARATTLNVYWEGLCDVVGTQDDQAVKGFAFAELANYAR